MPTKTTDDGRPAILVRDAVRADLAAITAIYGHHVLTGVGSFEEVPPAADEMAARLARVQDAGLPWLVAERDGTVVGYAYAGRYRERSAYRYTVEDSVYVDAGHAGQGIGVRLLAEVVRHCTDLGYRQMIAVIGGSENESSRRLHARCGFRESGCQRAVGLKFGRWLDIVEMQWTLGEGAETLPPDAVR